MEQRSISWCLLRWRRAACGREGEGKLQPQSVEAGAPAVPPLITTEQPFENVSTVHTVHIPTSIETIWQTTYTLPVCHVMPAITQSERIRQ
ncbi:hypothetical protein DPEC_G00251380 [Dallia pectoralis]|uniref:Uncharacterized protein n=1 Tax=Dallia pectoralis TaxID=75939 RepID=A0ACC2FTH4_DALPE|nr:hypothetical protein DPEC_G00251380 [Dallia pectoralis]